MSVPSNSGSSSSSSELPSYSMESISSSATTSVDNIEPLKAEAKYFKYEGKLSQTSKNILFFRASWCPTCKSLDANIKENISKEKSDIAIFDVDYDNSDELKRKYGVTYQHTLVQVDSNGNLIKKWSGSPSLSSLVSEIQ